MNSSFWGKIRVPFFIGVLVLVLAAGFFLYERLRGGVDLSVALPGQEMEVGVPFEMELKLANNSANALKNVRVQVELPDNILLVDKPDQKLIALGIGDMVNGRLERQTYRVVATPGEHPDYKVRAIVYYVPASVSANLQKRVEADAKVKVPEASLEFNVPERVFAGEEFTAEASYKNTLEPRDNNYSVEVKINHPPEMTSSYDPEPKGGNKNWRLEDTGRREGRVALQGAIELPDETNFSLTAQLIMRIFSKEYPIVSNTKNITINPSPLSFKVSLSGAGGVALGEELTYILDYRNNTNVSLEDVVIRAELQGEMFDLGTLETNGSADLLTGVLLWSPVQIKALEILDPGEGGQVSFAIRVKDKYPAFKKDPSLKVTARIESPTVPPPLNLKELVNVSLLEVRVASSTQ